MRLVTTQEAWDIARAMDEKQDEVYEQDKGNRDKLRYGLYKRLSDAISWLDMMCEHVKSDEAVIKLSDDVHVVLFDAFMDEWLEKLRD